MKKVAFVLALALTFVFSAYGEDWSYPYNASKTSDGSSRWPTVAFGPDGILHMVWAEYKTSTTSEIMYVNYDGTTWSSPIKLTDVSNRGCEFPFIYVGVTGMIAVAWDQGDECTMRVYDPVTKTWGDVEQVDEAEYGAGKPIVAIDSKNNIYIFYYRKDQGMAFSRSKINGVWEPHIRMNISGKRTTNGSVAVGRDDIVWFTWMEKQPGGDYKVIYHKRDASGWLMEHEKFVNSMGMTQALPYIAIDHTVNMPHIVFLGIGAVEGPNPVFMFTLNEKDNPRETCIDGRLQHYPRMAVDAYGVRHVATPIGPGDFGRGMTWTSNANEGHWSGPIVFPLSDAGPKLAGISADYYDGNVAISWDSEVAGYKEAFVTFLKPVETKYFNPPKNPTAKITLSGFKSNPTVKFDFSWERGDGNKDEYLQGYRIYSKEGDEDWKVYLTVNNETFSASYQPSTPLTKKIQFAITTVSKIGTESDKVSF